MTPADRITTPTEWQAANGEVPLSHVLRESDTRLIPVMGPPLAEAAVSSPEENSRSDLFDTVVLPVVPPRSIPAPMARREPPRPPVAARRSAKNGRPSAPVALRVTVLLLFLLFLATTGALVTLRVHPSTFDSLRQTYVYPAPSQSGTTRPPAVPTATHASLVSTTSSAITYSVPTSSYSIVVTISHPCWLVVRSPAGSSVPVLAKTIEPALSPLTVPLRGSASILIAARASSLSIVRGSTVLDTVENPRLGIEYTFVPTAS
jgi:hypothetical protein